MKKDYIEMRWRRPKGVPEPLPGSTTMTIHGYGIQKIPGNEELIDYLKLVLTAKPKVHPDAIGPKDVDPNFPVWRENSKFFYLPRAFGLDWFGPPAIQKQGNGDDAPGLLFAGTLRSEQEIPVQTFLEAARDPRKRGGILSMQCAAGKCLGKNTPILMYDGSIKMVQDVTVGDQLMGDDSTPRTVLSTCTGREEMFRVVPSKGDPYIVNRSHILSLKRAHGPGKGTIKDMNVMTFQKLAKTHPWRGFRVSIEFPPKPTPIHPYLFGSKTSDETREIPAIYRCNSREVRLNVLAGIIDNTSLWPTRNYKTTRFGYEIRVHHESFLHDILYLARSLGFAAYQSCGPLGCKPSEATSKNFVSEPSGSECNASYRTYIHGRGVETIPTKRKTVITDRSREPDVLLQSLQVQALPEDTYYGFEIDGNRRFVLGDFTVTHNTVMALNIACQIGKKTLVMCHKEFLIDQWKERIEMFVPTAKVGRIQGKTIHIEGCDIVLATIQSLAMKDFPPHFFAPFGLAIGDECHHLSAKVFSQALPKVSAPVMLGLSATLDRKDGLRNVFEWFLGRPVYENKKRADTQMIIRMIPYYDPHPDYGRERHLWNGKKNVPQMLNAICAFSPRNDRIMEELRKAIQSDPNRRVLILSDRRNHLKELERRIKAEHLGTVGYYVGGMKEQELRESQTKEVILATYTMASEGMDIPQLNTLLLASPVSAIEQPIGRIQRQKAHERKCIPLTIDVWDQFSIFENQGRKRMAFYRKNGYTIEGADEAPEDPEDDGSQGCERSAPKKPSYDFIDEEEG